MNNKNETISTSEGAAILAEIEPGKAYKSIAEELPQMLSRQQAAEFAGVSVQTISALCNKGALKGCRFGNRLRISRDSMLEYIGLA